MLFYGFGQKYRKINGLKKRETSMSCLGVHFALSEKDYKRLIAIDDENERLFFLQEEIEEEYFVEQEYVAESDKAWDAMHRSLTNGKLSYDGGKYPLNLVVLGGEILYNQDDYIMSLKSQKQVKDIFSAINDISKDAMRIAYYKINPDDYGFETSEEDFEYTWNWFQNVRKLYEKAFKENRYVLFTADQ